MKSEFIDLQILGRIIVNSRGYLNLNFILKDTNISYVLYLLCSDL